MGHWSHGLELPPKLGSSSVGPLVEPLLCALPKTQLLISQLFCLGLLISVSHQITPGVPHYPPADYHLVSGAALSAQL